MDGIMTLNAPFITPAPVAMRANGFTDCDGQSNSCKALQSYSGAYANSYQGHAKLKVVHASLVASLLFQGLVISLLAVVQCQ